LNKLLLYLLLLCTAPTVTAAVAQDSIAFTEAVAAGPGQVHRKERTFREGFREDYTGSDFDYEPKIKKEKTRWDRFKDWLKYWLSRFLAPGQSGGKVTGLMIAVRIVAFLALGLVVYLIARAILNKQGYWIFGKASKKIAVQDIDEQNIHEMDFGKLIGDAAHGSNYRLSVRYYYLWLLKKLSDREVIQLHSDKTNSEYLYEIRDKQLRKDFEYLSYVYDHSWYGEFELDTEAYAKVEKAFRKTINTL
jgi:hypothetical protein